MRYCWVTARPMAPRNDCRWNWSYFHAPSCTAQEIFAHLLFLLLLIRTIITALSKYHCPICLYQSSSSLWLVPALRASVCLSVSLSVYWSVCRSVCLPTATSTGRNETTAGTRMAAWNYRFFFQPSTCSWNTWGELVCMCVCMYKHLEGNVLVASKYSCESVCMLTHVWCG